MSIKKVSTFAPQPTTERGRAIQLSSDPKAKSFSYTNGRSVIIRDLANPGLASEYTGHTAHATVARWAPSGYYMASGDQSGALRIWDMVNEEHILKIETRPFAGKINDVAWDFESKRLVVVGEGKDKFGHAMLWDTGSSCGEILGHSKAINSVSIRPGRPIRAVTASDDFSVNFYTGVPFKFSKSCKDHTRFVQAVKYDSKGDYFVSAASDGKIILYEGKEGEKVGEFEGGHGGSVFGVAWDPTGAPRICSASADMTVKIWDVATLKSVNTIKFAEKSTFEHQQVACLWAGSFLISASLNGDLNYLDPRTPAPVKTIKGHSKSITALTRVVSSTTPSPTTFCTGSYDGRVFGWNSVGEGDEYRDGGHGNSVVGLGAVEKGGVWTCGMDDSVRFLSTAEKKFRSAAAFTTDSTPKDMSVSFGSDKAAVITKTHIQIYQNEALVKSIPVSSGGVPTAVAIDSQGTKVAVSGDDMKIRVYSIETGLVQPDIVFEGNRGEITCLAYSPDGKYLASGDATSKILCFDAATASLLLDQWVFHTGRITSMSWHPQSSHLVSSSLDTNIEIWSTKEPMKHLSVKNAHLESCSGVVWVDENTVVSVGGDAFIRVWKVEF